VLDERWLVWKSLQASARVLGSVFFDLRVDGLEHIPRHGGALIASNHQSYLDPILLNTRMRRPLNYLAKSELFENPHLGRLLRTVGVFPLHQKGTDFSAIRQAVVSLRAGQLLSIYPEGARTPNGRIGRIEKGIALILRRAHVPVIPVVIIGAYEAWPIFRPFPRPWPIRIRIGPPMDLAGKSSDEIVEAVDRTLRRMFDELTEESRLNDPSLANDGSTNGTAQLRGQSV